MLLLRQHCEPITRSCPPLRVVGNNTYNSRRFDDTQKLYCLANPNTDRSRRPSHHHEEWGTENAVAVLIFFSWAPCPHLLCCLNLVGTGLHCPVWHVVWHVRPWQDAMQISCLCVGKHSAFLSLQSVFQPWLFIPKPDQEFKPILAEADKYTIEEEFCCRYPDCTHTHILTVVIQ